MEITLQDKTTLVLDHVSAQRGAICQVSTHCGPLKCHFSWLTADMEEDAMNEDLNMGQVRSSHDIN